MNIIKRPCYNVTDLKTALAFDWRGWHLSRKMDGCWQQCDFAGSILTGEIMRDGRFHAFDIPVAHGQDVRRLPWIERRAALRDVAATFPADMMLCAEGTGREFIEAVLGDGGEGIVAKPWDSAFGDGWTKVKRVETYDCTVTELNVACGSIRLALDGQDGGWCPCRAAFDQIRIGDVVEVKAFARHNSGKFKSSKFIRIRTDKDN